MGSSRKRSGMSSTGVTPAEALSAYISAQKDLTHVCVAYSTGMDSHVLLHAAADLLAESDTVYLRAVHIDHGMQADCEQWVRHAEFVCDGLNVPLHVRRVTVLDEGQGPEAAARQARYEAYAELLMPGEHLLLAQHADDQAETFLLQALRGAGPDGLASIPRKRTFLHGYMARPLLGCTKQALIDYAKLSGLSWIEDPSNDETQYDRNYLRHEILPLLRDRWPAASQTLSRAAMRNAAASQMLQEVAQNDFEVTRIRGTNELSISNLNELTRERAFNVIRYWVRMAGLRMPRQKDLMQVSHDLLQPSLTSSGMVNARDYEFRRYRDSLHLVAGHVRSDAYSVQWDAPYNDLQIPETGQVLSRKSCQDQGIALPKKGSVTVRSRHGGELIKLGEPAFHKAVKKVLQEASVPPWKRETIPLLYVDDRLIAVWNIAVAVDFRVKPETA